MRLLLFLVACHARPHETAGNPYREPARAILEQKCGMCHRKDSPDANPKALAVFTLNDVDFSRNMNEIQLKDMLGRFTGEITNDNDVKPAELDTMRKFVEAERKRKIP
jgi:hypothetical protein